MNKVRVFIVKLLLFSIPFVLFIGFYFYLDPFKVVRHYDSFYESGKPNYITLNKDYISTENWLNHYDSFRYTSYIFGNSRSMFYNIGAWKNYIGEDSSKCYHFDASGESLYGISKKFSFLAAHNAPIKHALLIVDEALLNMAHNSAGHLFLKDPRISGESNIGFQVECLKDFFDFSFLRALVDFKVSGKMKDYMQKEFLLDDRPFYYDYVTNEVRLDFFEQMIRNNPHDYYGPRQGIFYLRDSSRQQYASPRIHDKQLVLLNIIRDVCKKDGTDCRIVISPLYDQRKLNPGDLKILKQLFGERNVFDFSGINAFTKDIYNYYETSHYRPHIADEIMKIVYSSH
jgi:hypothetical protein